MIQLDRIESAALLRKALRARFPKTRFSVRLGRGTSHFSCDVDWSGAPSREEVHEVADPFSSEGFDGMTDSTTHREAVVESPDGPALSALGLILLHGPYASQLAKEGA